MSLEGITSQQSPWSPGSQDASAPLLQCSQALGTERFMDVSTGTWLYNCILVVVSGVVSL